MIYFDNSATTPINPQVYDAMQPYLSSEYGNASSKYYTLAVRARDAVEKARGQIAALINAEPGEIVFTCGSTESNNTIIKGIADYQKYYEKRGNHIITSKVEHHATLNTCRFLNGDIYSNHDATFSLDGSTRKVDRGYSVTFLDVNPFGQVEPCVFEDAICKETTIASIIWGNNEIASLNDVAALGNIAHEHGVFFHSDATQVLGKLEIDVTKQPIDALSFSAHKLQGPKGVGALWVRGDQFGLPPFTSLMHGGEQENGVRGGTLNVSGIVGFGKAAELAANTLSAKKKKLLQLDKEITSLICQYPWIELLGDPVYRIPGIYSIVINVPAFNNELFVKQIGNEIAISTGSACTAGEPSHVLQAIGRGYQTGKVLRISICEDMDVGNMSYLLESIKRCFAVI